jgi:hypothetical protein
MNNMGGACCTYGRQEMRIEFLWEDLRERDYVEDQGEDGRIILKCVFKKRDREV